MAIVGLNWYFLMELWWEHFCHQECCQEKRDQFEFEFDQDLNFLPNAETPKWSKLNKHWSKTRTELKSMKLFS